MAQKSSNAKQQVKRVQLQDAVTFVGGINVTRLASKQQLDSELVAAVGDLLFVHAGGELRAVTEAQAGEVITANYTKVIPSSQIHPGYLRFLFSGLVFPAPGANVAAAGSAPGRIPLSEIKGWQVPLPPLPEQQLVGECYLKMLELQDQYREAAVLVEQLFRTVMKTQNGADNGVA